MPSSFTDEFLADAWPDLLDTFAQTAILTRKSQQTTLSAIVDQEEVKTKDVRGVMVTRMQSVLLIKATDYTISDIVRDPETIDKFSIGSRTYQCHMPDGKKRCWEYSGPDAAILKVYVQEL